MVDLLKVLSDKDKEILTSYIDHFGILKEYFKGVDAWLVNWNKSKQKLYHLLGNQLIAKKEVVIEKDDEIIRKEKKEFIDKSNFLDHLYDFTIRGYNKFIEEKEEGGIFSCISDSDFEDFLIHITDTHTIINGVCEKTFKYKWKNKKILQIQKGTKILRAIGKFMEYFSEFYNPNEGYVKVRNVDLFAEFQNFCNGYSLVTNDKYLKGRLCLSIIPMDFLTMSDNAEKWTSCMNWTKEGTSGGCYHVGTVEMMNSNCVIVAYLENPNRSFSWGEDEEYQWNSKRWRVLLYATKDILVSGKSYPYYNKNLTFAALEFLHELAGTNMDWHYEYGIESYLDMIHIGNANRMDNNKYWIQNNKTKKHNIIFDSHGMYNDMLNANLYPYWCYRNKVKHNIIINYSGKSTCLCCNKQVSTCAYEDDDDYNSRWIDTGDVVCDSCRTKYRCARCHNLLNKNILGNHEIVRFNGLTYCYNCFLDGFGSCPDCGALFRVHDSNSDMENEKYKNEPEIFAYDENVLGMTLSDFSEKILFGRTPIEFFNKIGQIPYYFQDNECPSWARIKDHPEYAFKPLHMCPDCKEKFLKENSYTTFDLNNLKYYNWGDFKRRAANFRLLDKPITRDNPKMYAKYRYNNLNN